ncbi:hypothetical protein DU53_00445 [Kosmotoga sp. DU53]|nr:hypothetical protein DU53_00445 [Kosmotoga sp. DU53]
MRLATLIKSRECENPRTESPRKNKTLARLSAGGATLEDEACDADKKPRVRESKNRESERASKAGQSAGLRPGGLQRCQLME